MKNCPECNAALGEKDRFCPYCMKILNAKKVIPSGYARRRKRACSLLLFKIFALIFALFAILLLLRIYRLNQNNDLLLKSSAGYSYMLCEGGQK